MKFIGTASAMDGGTMSVTVIGESMADIAEVLDKLSVKSLSCEFSANRITKKASGGFHISANSSDMDFFTFTEFLVRWSYSVASGKYMDKFSKQPTAVSEYSVEFENELIAA